MVSKIYQPLDIVPLPAEFFKDECKLPMRLPLKADGLPYHLHWFGQQIAGHKTQVDKKTGQQQLGFIKDIYAPERILKPVMNDKRGKREKCFYEDVFSSSANPNLRLFRGLIPHFFQLRDITFKNEKHELLELDDITADMRVPVVIDIKIGKQTWGPDANEEKMRRERAKYPQQEQIGFRILGYKMEGKKGQQASLEREKCLTLQPEDIEGVIAEYLSFRPPSDLQEMVDKILIQLEDVRYAMSMGVFHMYSSSLLIAYEADSTLRADPIVKMIDFSHVFNGDGRPDENYLYGLNTLCSHLENIRESV